MYLHQMGKRGCDPQGCGHYKAKRGGGKRKHNGIDLCSSDDTSLPENIHVQLGFKGEVVKVNIAYSDPAKAKLKYVAIKIGEYYARVFYVDPWVKVGDTVEPTDVIGLSCDLEKFYSDMKNHVHFEVYKLKDKNKGEHNRQNFQYVDPEPILEFLRAGRVF